MSMSRFCEIFQANNGDWFMDLAADEDGERRDAFTYGPFVSEQAAEEYLADNHSNPGSLYADRSGDRPVPTVSPNGRPVTDPSARRRRGW